MSIRKHGTEPASTEIRSEDNDQETLDSLTKASALPPEILDTIDRAANDSNFGERRERPRRN
jgi:hypothetical protein